MLHENEQYQTHNWKDIVILIAEDEEVNYRFLEVVFNTTGAKILRARNGQEAVELCRNMNDINLVLMDIKMPLMDGYEAAIEILKIRKDLPIIAQTAYASQNEVKKCKEIGFSDYITKPLNIKLLMQKIIDIL